MKMYIGIDSGSTMCKAVLFDGMKILDTSSLKTSWNPQLSARKNYETLIKRNGLDEDAVLVAATGYGREAVDFARQAFTEISCHAMGGMHLLPEIQGIIDIGGQDSKVIRTAGGRVMDFLMNDKCAAGTGRFLSMAGDVLEIELSELDAFADLKNAIPINSMCTVFAESEIIGMMAQQKERTQIMGGVLKSIAQKIQQMSGRIGFEREGTVLMTGGLSQSKALAETISEAIGIPVTTHGYSAYAGAVGACLCSMKKETAGV